MAELSHKSVRSKGVLENCMVRRALPFGFAQQQNFQEASSQEISKGDEMRVCGTHTACPSSFLEIAQIAI